MTRTELKAFSTASENKDEGNFETANISLGLYSALCTL